jgi:hypothetical protein
MARDTRFLEFLIGARELAPEGAYEGCDRPEANALPNNIL